MPLGILPAQEVTHPCIIGLYLIYISTPPKLFSVLFGVKKTKTVVHVQEMSRHLVAPAYSWVTHSFGHMFVGLIDFRDKSCLIGPLDRKVNGLVNRTTTATTLDIVFRYVTNAFDLLPLCFLYHVPRDCNYTLELDS